MTGIALQPCPAGTFNPSTGLSQESQCTNCTGGFYCSVTNLTAESGPCDAGYYCRSGSDDPTPTPASTGDAGPCPEGYYCEQQTQDPVPCPAGTFNNRTMLTNVSECQDCTPGYYCEVPGLSAPTNLCDAGFYCSGASDSASPPAVTATGGPCPVGKYCEVGTSVPQDCPAGTFTDVEKQSICQNCSMGYYCTAGSSSQVICPKGRFLTQANGIFHKGTYNKVRMVHCIYWGVTGYNWQKYCISFSENLFFVLANSADPDEMLHYAAFHLGLHWMLKYPFRGFWSAKG